MSKHFVVKLPRDSPAIKLTRNQEPSPATYVAAQCPKCGKWTYGVAGQKGKKCPVCRRQYPLAVTGEASK